MYKRGKHVKRSKRTTTTLVAGGLAGVLAISSVPLAAIAQNEDKDDALKSEDNSSATESNNQSDYQFAMLYNRFEKLLTHQVTLAI